MNVEESLKLVSESRQITIKLIFFIFSITVISIGYSINITQSAKPSCWLILWGLSIIAMSSSLFFGGLYIQRIQKLMGFFILYYSFKGSGADKYTNDIKSKSHVELKNEATRLVKNESSDVLYEFDEINLLKIIKARANDKNCSPIYFINSASENDLKQLFLNMPYNVFGYDSEIDALYKCNEQGKKDTKCFKWQLTTLGAGYVLFAVWYIGRIFTH